MVEEEEAEGGEPPESDVQHLHQEQILEDIPIINMSAGLLSQTEIGVLSKGFHFCPSKKFNLYNTILDVLTLRKHFKSSVPPSNPARHEIKQYTSQFSSFQDQCMISTLQSLQQDSIPSSARTKKIHLTW